MKSFGCDRNEKEKQSWEKSISDTQFSPRQAQVKALAVEWVGGGVFLSPKQNASQWIRFLADASC